MFRSALFVRAICIGIALISGASIGNAQRITIETAVQTAISNHPSIKITVASAGIARGDLRTARSFVNPDFGLAFGPARASDTSLTALEFGVGQLIEIGGKRSARSNAAAARVRSADAGVTRQTQLVALDARRTFSLVVVAQQRLSAAQEADSLGAALLRAAEERVELGVGTTLDVNVAAAAAARDKRQRLTAEQGLTDALFEFRAAIGVLPSSGIEPEGSFSPTTMPVQSEDALVAAALTGRPDLNATAEERSAAASDVRYARALAWPDPSLGLTIGRDDFRSRLFTIGIALPLWNRAGGLRASANAGLERATVTESAARQNVEREVREAYRALARSIEAARSFESEVVARLSTNLSLAREAFENGKISLITYNTIRRELVAARLEYFDSLADVTNRRFQLAAASGGAWE